jgi:hypothetical protein
MRQIKNLVNQTFGYLTVLSQEPNLNPITCPLDVYWNCLCKCGKMTTVKDFKLITGHKKSCGCLKHEPLHLAPFNSPKFSPEKSSARGPWRRRYTDLPFDVFFELAKKPCVYCGTLYCLERESNRKDSVIFKYNTLDRIDSSLGHIVGNVVPACLICNCAKLERSMSAFMDYISKLNENRISPANYRQQTTLIDTSIMFQPEKYAWLSSIKHTLRLYNDGDIKLEQFYRLASSNCYYCGMQPINKRNKSDKKSTKYARETGVFLYNGLDRVDNNIPTHDYDNVVPCCKYCNTAKSELTMQEFDNWIIRLKNYQATNKLEIISTPF